MSEYFNAFAAKERQAAIDLNRAQFQISELEEANAVLSDRVKELEAELAAIKQGTKADICSCGDPACTMNQDLDDYDYGDL